MRLSSAVAAIACALAVRAADHLVKVGANGLTFDPNQLTGVAQGDTVTFEFHPKNHSVTQSTFTDPCQQSPGGVNSGYLATDPAATQFSQWQITIDNASAPLWFFCAQVTPAVHCHSGMVFAINPTAEKSFEQYQTNANNSQLTFTDAGQPPQPTAAGQTQAGATTGSTQTGAPPAGNPPPGVAGATAAVTSGTIGTAQIPSPAPTLTTGGGLGAAGGVSTNSAGAPGQPSAASRTAVGLSGLLGVVVMLGLLL